MPLLPVILWTDALIYLLLAAVAGLVWYIRRQEHLRAPWWRVAQTPGGEVQITAPPHRIRGRPHKLGAVPAIGQHSDALRKEFAR